MLSMGKMVDNRRSLCSSMTDNWSYQLSRVPQPLCVHNLSDGKPYDDTGRIVSEEQGWAHVQA